MILTNSAGVPVGRAALTPDDVAMVAQAIRSTMVGRPPATAQRAAITTAGGWTPTPAPTPSSTPAARRRRRWPWALLLLFGLFWLIGACNGGADDGAPAGTAPITITRGDSGAALEGGHADTPIGSESPRAQRTVVTSSGDIVVAGAVVDNVRRADSPIRARFVAAVADAGIPTAGRSADASVGQAITFCRDLSVGRSIAMREAVDAGAGNGDRFGTGTARRAITSAALRYVCPEYE